MISRIILIILFSGFLKCYSQISEGGLPVSFGMSEFKNTNAIPQLILESINSDYISESISDRSGIPYKYSIIETLNIDIKERSLKQDIPEAGGTIWRYCIGSPDALSLQVIFSEFNIPEGATLFIYDEARSAVYGAFTSRNMNSDRTFTIADYKGNRLFLEYFEPFRPLFPGSLVIGKVGKAYRDIFDYNLKSTDEFGINGYDGRKVQNEKHAVGKITFVDGNTGYACTGTLLNNVRKDGTPYLLTANHCLSTQEAASTLVAYFNYEDPMTGGRIDLNNTITGSTLLSTGKNSDYTLLLLSKAPPYEYRPFYAGWDISDETGNSSYSIHHAGGGLKKVAHDLASPVNYSKVIWWGVSDYSPAGSHWKTEFDLGSTQGGSSGAPLFNKDNLVIGQLHGGNNTTDFFGKLSYSWTRSQSGKSLKSWLDPDGTDTLRIEGYYPSQNLPDAGFFTEFTQICAGSSVTLEDGSAFEPLNRKWIVTPSDIEYLNGTDSFSVKPEIKFNSPGSYSVKLIVENAAGLDTIVRKDYIDAGTDIAAGMFLVNSLDSCLCSFDSLTILARGASDYLWSVADTSNFYSGSYTGNTFIIKAHNELSDTVKTIGLELMASQNECRDTLVLEFPLISQPNDNLKNAIEIIQGKNGPFSNKCATVELLEPVPPHFSCTDQLSWCNETGVDILMNSVWFKFTAPPSGIVSLASEGIDNEIAVYYADKYEDIPAGKSTLLAANDDRSAVDYNPVIYSINVIPGKTYYVQVDGSGGGMEGEFYLTLDSKAIISGSNNLQESTLKIYPLPAGDFVTVQLPGTGYSGNCTVEIFDLTGRLAGIEEINNTGTGFTIPTHSLMSGVYIVKVSANGTNYYGRMVK